MNKSIYLSAIEYSSNKIFEGVTFDEVRVFIEKKFNKKFDAESEFSFFKFFMETHYTQSIYLKTDNKQYEGVFHNVRDCLKHKYGNKNIDISSSNHIYKEITSKSIFFLNGEGDKRLLDFLELREARLTSRQAFILSILAIIISVIAAFLTPFINYFFEICIKPFFDR